MKNWNYFLSKAFSNFRNILPQDTFPFVKQEYPWQCGPACLKMICMYYKIDADLDILEILSNMDKYEGTSVHDLDVALDCLEFETLAGKLLCNQLIEQRKQIPLPAILHWRDNSFVVLYHLNRTSFWICDPAIGKVRYNKEEFSNFWLENKQDKEGVILFLQRK